MTSNNSTGAVSERKPGVGRHAKKATTFFEKLWKRDETGWANLETTEWQVVYDRQIAMLEGRSYGRALEIGCGAGCMTGQLARITDHLVALDVAPTALDHARRKVAGPNRVD